MHTGYELEIAGIVLSGRDMGNTQGEEASCQPPNLALQLTWQLDTPLARGRAQGVRRVATQLSFVVRRHLRFVEPEDVRFRSGSLVWVVMSVLSSNATAQPTQTVKCEATLIEYQARFRWTEWNESGELSLVAPLVTFRIVAPKEFVGRTVRVILFSSEFEQIVAEPEGAAEARFALELPADYFDGKDALMIRDDAVLSIEQIAQLR